MNNIIHMLKKHCRPRSTNWNYNVISFPPIKLSEILMEKVKVLNLNYMTFFTFQIVMYYEF